MDVKLKSKMKKFFLLIALSVFLFFSSNVMASCFTTTRPKYDSTYKTYVFKITNTCDDTIRVCWETWDGERWISRNTLVSKRSFTEVSAGPEGYVRNIRQCE